MLGLVLRDQNALGHGRLQAFARDRRASLAGIGRSNERRPSRVPASLSTHSLPPTVAGRLRRQMASPRPVPEGFSGERVAHLPEFSKISAWFSG